VLRTTIVTVTVHTVTTTQRFSGICTFFEHSEVPHSEHSNVLRTTIVIVTVRTVMTTQRFSGTCPHFGHNEGFFSSTVTCSAPSSLSPLRAQS